MHILYVENHARFAEIAVKTFLSDHHVTVVPGLAAARQELADNHFDLVLLDQDLDDGKGVELAREIVARSERPPVIAVSSHEEGNRALLAAGANGVCAKRDFARIALAIEAVANLARTESCAGTQ